MLSKMKETNRTILVTGATGQIGSALTMELRKEYGNEKVIAAGYKTKPKKDLLDSGPFEYIDVTQKEKVEKSVENYNIDTIYHLAAILSVKGEKKPELAWKVNVLGLFNILEITKKYNLVSLFWPSSIAVFGPESPRVKTPQETVLIPRTMYGVTKVTGELLCNYYFNRFNVDVRSVRFPGIISSKTPPGGGATDYTIAMIKEAIRKKHYKCFVAENTTLPMMYMPDCIRATINLMKANPSTIRHISYNISAMSFSAGELAAEIKKYIPEFKIEYKPDFRQKIADSWPQSMDDSVARNEWGWKPRYSLSSMVKDIIPKLSK